MPRHASDYTSAQVNLARSTCLYVATKLGDLRDDIVVVGGLVPSLLIPQKNLLSGVSAHIGTLDLDLALALALLDKERYHTLAERLREAGFSEDKADSGKPTRQRWRMSNPISATVDFLIPPSQATDRGGTLRNLESDFAAFITPGLHLAFIDRILVGIKDTTPTGEVTNREIWVCGPGAFTVLKALAFALRGQNKDAYDLYYVVRNYGRGIEDVVDPLRPLLSDPNAAEAMAVLRRDFRLPNSLGPVRVAEFLFGRADEDTQADVAGFIGALLTKLA